VWIRIAAAISTRSSDSGHILVLDPFQAVTGDVQPASFMAATTSGFRFNAIATPTRSPANCVRQKSHNRQKPAREPYSNIDSILAWRRRPGLRAQHIGQERLRGAIAVENIVLAAFLEFTTKLHRDRALPGHLGSGGLRP